MEATDIGFQNFIILPARFKWIGYLAPFNMERICFLAPTPPEDAKYYQYFKTFTPGQWIKKLTPYHEHITIFFQCFLIFRIVDCYWNIPDILYSLYISVCQDLSQCWIWSHQRSLWHNINFPLSRCINGWTYKVRISFNPSILPLIHPFNSMIFIFRHNGSRLFLVLFIFIAFVITTAYKGNLLALLTVKTFPEPVHDFEGLAKWVKAYKKVLNLLFQILFSTGHSHCHILSIKRILDQGESQSQSENCKR